MPKQIFTWLLLLIVGVPLSAQATPVTLTFNVGLRLPDPRMLDAIVLQFATADPAIDAVIWQDNNDTSMDCGVSDVLGGVPAIEIHDIAPLLAADDTLTPDAFLPGIFQAITTADGTITGLPLAFLPQALWINIDAFAEADIPLPTTGWTPTTFTDAINRLDVRRVLDIYGRHNINNRYILLLAGALGSVPLDYRSTPPPSQLTAPATVDAVQQISTLVLRGALEYDTLFSTDGSDLASAQITGAYEPPILLDSVGLQSQRLAFMSWDARGNGRYRPVPYPQATDAAPVVSYTTISGYINAETDHIDACYRLLRTLADQPELFFSPPAQISLIDDPNFINSRLSPMTDYLRAFEAKLTDPAEPAMVLPLEYSAVDLWPNQWFNRAFDQIIGGSTPANALTVAQSHTEAYYICMEPVLNASTLPADELQQAVSACAQAVDPDGYVLLFGENAGD